MPPDSSFFLCHTASVDDMTPCRFGPGDATLSRHSKPRSERARDNARVLHSRQGETVERWGSDGVMSSTFSIRADLFQGASVLLYRRC